MAQAVRGAHPHLHALLYSNILLTGEGAGWVGGCVVAWVGGWVRGWVVRIAGGEGACLQLDCSSPRQTQTVPAHDVPCCGRTRLPALPCPVLQAAQRGVRGSGIGCMPSCGRWCQTITRWVCILSLFLGGGDGGGGGGGGLACVVVHSCGHVVCLECLCLCVRPACPPAHMSAFPGTCLPIHTPAHPLAPPAAVHLPGRRSSAVCLEGSSPPRSFPAVPAAGGDSAGVEAARGSCTGQVGCVAHLQHAGPLFCRRLSAPAALASSHFHLALGPSCGNGLLVGCAKWWFTHFLCGLIATTGET